MRSLIRFYCDIGWRWHMMLTLVIASVFIFLSLGSDAANLRVPMIVACGSGLVLLKEFPTEWPKGETEWFKTIVALVAAAILLWAAVLIADGALARWASVLGTDWSGARFIGSAFLIFSLIAAWIPIVVAWLVYEFANFRRQDVRPRLESENTSVIIAATQWAEARRLSDEALEAAREAGRLEGNPPP